MKKLILIAFFALCALVGMSQTFDYQVKGWQLQTDTSYVEGDIPETIGTLFWDKENHTISVILEDGVKGQMFQEIHIYGKNTSGVVISNGMAVSLTTNPAQFATFEKTDITSISSARAFVGLATEDIGVNEFGYVTITGNVRDIPTLTTGLTEKNPVYVSTTPGLLTSTMPNAPNICILVGNCERAHATQGRINVNSSIMPRLQDLSDVNGTPLTTKGQIPVWDEANNYFDFDYNIWPDLISNEAYGSSWDGVDSVAPSKNAIYDKIQSISGGSTNLGYTASATNGIVTSDTGTDATIPAGSTTNASLMLPADKTKLDGIAANANYYDLDVNVNGVSDNLIPFSTLKFTQGTNVNISRNASADYTISASSTNLSYDATTRVLSSSTGSAATIPLVDASNAGLMSTAQSSNLATAYAWGNHAGLYRPVSWVPSWTDVTSKPTFATVATSGSYTDLINKPTIPTNTNQLTNGAGFITGYTETDPTIYAWAKAATKPSYTYSEVGAQATLVSGTNIKTINGVSLLGVGDLTTSGGVTNLGYTASATNGIVTSDTGTDATIPAGSTTNASLMLPDDKTKLNGIAIGADNYGYWAFKVNGGSPQTVPSANTLNFIAGTNTTITRSGFDLTFSSTGGSMVYPSAGIPISTGTAWGTSITNNSSNWNTAYGWGNHASQGYVNSILINGTSGENAGGFLDFIPGSGINITKTGGHVTIAATGGSMVYPSAGLAKSTGSGWGTSITDNSSNWNDAHSNMGKTSTDGSFFAYLNPSYFTSLGGWKPTTLSEPTPFSDKAFSAGGAYTALNAKQDALSGTGFVKISGTTISYDNNTYALLNGSLSQDFSGRSFLLPNSINVNGNDGIARLVNGGHSFALFSNGDASIDGIFTASELYRGSSKELKHNIKPYKGNALDILNATKIYTYNLNSDNSFGVGFLAEDTHKWLSGENQKSHAMGNHLGLLTKAIQEQIIVIEEMQKQISDLQIEIKKLKKRQLKRK